ncbi:hypothetical protein HFN89_05530 [Rhizobium laguerreae]|nr:hypothetical protein [Rhizobium laguerreae]
MKINLVAAVDELIVLHAGIAATLLKEFPKTYGITFNLDGEPAGAYPRADVPPGYASGYSHAKFERRAEKLLRATTPRLLEIVDSLAPLGIRLRDVVVAATRLSADIAPDGVVVTGAFSGGLGAAAVRREMLATKGRVLGLAAAEFHLIGIVEDRALVPAIDEAGKDGLLSGLNHLIQTNLVLNCDATQASCFRDWLDCFPGNPENCEGTYGLPIYRFIAKSNHNEQVLYVTSETYESLDIGDANVIPFDPERGFDIAPYTQAAAKSFKP